MRAAVGLHPWFAVEEPDVAWLPPLLDAPGVVAVGEIGIDGETATPIDLQKMVFRAQLRLAAERGLPVLLHCRRGWDTLLAGLRDFPVRGVAHSFSASREVMAECLRLGLYLSFSGMVTRANSRRAREAARLTPADRLLLETDAPFMATNTTPAAQVEPRNVAEVYDFIRQLRGAGDELEQLISGNAHSLFSNR